MNIGGVAIASGSGSRSHSKREPQLLVEDRHLAVEHQGARLSCETAAAMPTKGRVW